MRASFEKRHGLLLMAVAISFWFGSGPSADAQIELLTKVDYRIYLQFEPVQVRTTVRSRIGQPVVFNAEGDGPRFYYEVRDDYGIQLSLLPDVTPPGAVMVAAQDSITFTNIMNRLYPMVNPGHYSIQACVDWLGKTYRGEKHYVEIVKGREVTRIAGLVPDDGTTRTYMIFHINRGQQDHMLLRIDDEAADVCYGVIPLGRSVMNEKPELAIDGSGQAHLLFQAAPQAYIHAIFSPYGNLISSQTFGREYSAINLKSQPNGSIEAVGRRTEPTGPPVIHSILNNR